MSAAAFLYGKNGHPKAVYTADTLVEVERYAADWPHGVSYWTDDVSRDEPVHLDPADRFMQAEWDAGPS